MGTQQKYKGTNQIFSFRDLTVSGRDRREEAVTDWTVLVGARHVLGKTVLCISCLQERLCS